MFPTTLKAIWSIWIHIVQLWQKYLRIVILDDVSNSSQSVCVGIWSIWIHVVQWWGTLGISIGCSEVNSKCTVELGSTINNKQELKWAKTYCLQKTRGPKGHISCTWVQCASFLTDQPGQEFLFTHRPEKHKLGRRRWDLAPCEVSLNSVQRFQRKSRKCPSQSEASAAILFFRSARKTQTW